MSWRDVCHRAIQAGPEWRGVGWGYVLPIDLPGAEAMEVDLTDAVLLRQMQRIFDRVVDENMTKLRRATRSEKRSVWKGVVWSILKRLRVPGAWTSSSGLRGWLSEWDVELLERYDALLGRIYDANREAVDRTMNSAPDGA